MTARLAALVLLVLGTQVAVAQETPPPAAGGAGGGAKGGQSGGGSHGFVVTDPEDIPSVYGVERSQEGESRATVRGPSGEVPAMHVVKKGDTLWDISSSYFGNPWQWPKVWSYNPNITNPHWIFPGDMVHLVPASASGPAAAPASPVANGSRGRIRKLGTLPNGDAQTVRELGFVEEGELKAASRISGSREEKILLSKGDQAYVEYPKDRPLAPGERYTIYKVEREVVHPVHKRRIGYVVAIMGELTVEQITSGAIARSTIVESDGAIERGYRVGPLARRWRNIEAQKNGGNIEGYLVAALRPLTNIEAEQIVFLDRGKKDGVVDGNRFFVIRRGDGYKKLLSDETVSDDPRYPKEVMAEVFVLEAHERTSVGYVSRVNKEIHPGDRVEMRRGY